MAADPTTTIASSLMDCDKIKLTFSPLQIVDYSKIRDKSKGVSFATLRSQISTCGFREEISTIFGIILSPPFTDEDTKQFTEGLSKFRLQNLNLNNSIIGLIDGAQRVEAICQLMELKTFPKFPMNYEVSVTVPDPDKYTAPWVFSKVVAAAFFLNQITKTDVPVSCWDRVKGLESFIGAIKKEYPELWECGLPTRIAKTVFLLNMQRMGSNLFECLVLKKRTLSLKNYYGMYMTKAWQVTSNNNVHRHLQDMHFEQKVDDYSAEFDLFEAVLENSLLNSCFSHISQTGTLSPGYSLLLNPEAVSSYPEDTVPRFEIDLQHKIFDKNSFQILLQCKSQLQTVCLLLRLCSKSKTESDIGSFTIAWLTQEKNMVDLAIKQLDLLQNIKQKYASYAAAADEAAAIAKAGNNDAPNNKSKKRKSAEAGINLFLFLAPPSSFINTTHYNANCRTRFRLC